MPSDRSTSATSTTTALVSRRTGLRLSSCTGVFASQILFEPPPDALYRCCRYMQAASQGNAQAQNSLAYCYRYGHGVKVDKTEAVRLYVASPFKILVCFLSSVLDPFHILSSFAGTGFLQLRAMRGLHRSC
jgi:hypothetical protein